MQVNARYSSGLLVVTGLGVPYSVLVPAGNGTSVNDMDPLFWVLGRLELLQQWLLYLESLCYSHGDWAGRRLQAHSALLHVLPSRKEGFQPVPM